MLVCRHLCGHRGASCGTELLDIRRPPFDDDYCDDYDGCNDCHEYENYMNSPLYDIITKWYVVAQIKQNSSGELMMMMSLAFFRAPASS